MKRGTLLHPELSMVIAALGHGDTVVIADAGLPVPHGVKRIDLGFAPGKPSFLDVLDAVLAEMEVEAATVASELHLAESSEFREALHARLTALPKVTRAGGPVMVPHEQLKALTRDAKAIIRTGEFTPYANVILTSSVVF
ncbi:MAG: D-ribose pyranase [Anaeromyxobacter sp.]